MSRFHFHLNSLATTLSASPHPYHPTAHDDGAHFHYATPFLFFNLQVAQNLIPLFPKTSALPPVFFLLPARCILATSRPLHLQTNNGLHFSSLRTLKLSCSVFGASRPLFSAVCALFDKKRRVHSAFGALARWERARAASGCGDFTAKRLGLWFSRSAVAHQQRRVFLLVRLLRVGLEATPAPRFVHARRAYHDQFVALYQPLRVYRRLL